MLRRSLFSALVVLTAGACGTDTVAPALDDTPVPPQPPFSPDPRLVAVTPVKPRVELNGSVLLQAFALGDQQQVLPFARFEWWSSRPDIATVDSVGLVRAHAPGHATVSAASGSASAYASVYVVVNGEYPTIVTLDPQLSSMTPCQPVQLRASTDPDVGAQTFAWRSSDTLAVRVSDHGLLQGVAPGMATVTAIWAQDTTRRASRTMQVQPC